MIDIKYSWWLVLFGIQLLGFTAMYKLLPNPPAQHQELADQPTYAPLYNKIKSAANKAYWQGVRQQTTAYLSSPQAMQAAFENLLRHEMKDFIAPYRKGYVVPQWQTVSAAEQQQAYDRVRERIEQSDTTNGWSPKDVAELGAYINKLSPDQHRELLELYFKNHPSGPEQNPATGAPLFPPPL